MEKKIRPTKVIKETDMTKHHQSRAEQINNKANGTPLFHFVKQPYKASDVDRNAVQSRAYQLYQQKGGHALDNWLEAEKEIKNREI